MPYIYASGSSSTTFAHSLDKVPNVDKHVMHAHDTCEILYVLSGEGQYLVESTVYTLQPGSVLLMRPGEVHKLQIDPSAPYERICLQFEVGRLDAFPTGDELLHAFIKRSLGCENLYTPDEFDSEFFHHCLRHIEATGGRHMFNFVIENSLPALLAELYQAFYKRRKINPHAAESVIQTRLQEILAYVNNHINENLSLDDLCQHFFISKTQLGRLFYNATGSTVWDYILVKRLIEARRLILAGIPITHAAQTCGFRDYSAFYRAYLKRYKISPAKDRRTYTVEVK